MWRGVTKLKIVEILEGLGNSGSNWLGFDSRSDQGEATRYYLGLFYWVNFMSYVYAIKFSCGLVKVGRTHKPKERISTHASTVRNVSGSEIIKRWVSQPHTNNSENEEKLIRFCSSISDPARSSGREWFNGCNFDAVITYAETLNYSNDFVERKKINEETTNKYLDKMYGTVEQRNDIAKSELSYSCAKKLEDFIVDSLWIGGDIFKVDDKFGLSPFVVMVGAYFYSGNPVEMLIEAMSQILICDDEQISTTNDFYLDACSHVAKLLEGQS